MASDAAPRAWKRHLLFAVLGLAAALPVAAGTEYLYSQVRILINPSRKNPKLWKRFQQDENGVPWVDYAPPLGRQRNPATVSLIAFDHWDAWKGGDEKGKTRFLNCANWIVENAEDRGSFSTLEFRFKWPRYGRTAPWRSALAQGWALQVLVRAHSITQEDRYLAMARKLLAALFVEVKDGGVTRKTETEGWWYEEPADEDAQAAYVLNGMLFTMVALEEYRKYTNDPKATVLFDHGIAALKSSLHLYDCPEEWTSFYCRLGDPVGDFYAERHVRLLADLHAISGEPVLKEFSDRWADYRTDSFIIKLFREPTARRIRSVAGAGLAAFLLLEAAAWWIARRRRRARLSVAPPS